MGQSTNAILFYGYCWDEEGTLWEDKNSDGEVEEPDERWARLNGVTAPEIPWADAPKVAGLYEAYWDAKRRAYAKAGVEVSTHCSGDCPIPYVAVTESVVLARRGYPEKVESLETGAGWDEKLDAFCKMMGIKRPQRRPRWWLVSDWN